MSESEQSQLTTQKSSQASSSIEVQQTYWSRDLAGNNFNTVKTRASDADATVYHTLLVNANRTYHWLASRSSYVGSTGGAYWGLGRAGAGDVGCYYLFYSNGSTSFTSYAVRPVVSLPSDIIDMEAGYNEETGWNLKSDEEIANHTVMVGDYINYTPTGATSYTTDKTYTGYDSNETLNREDLKWRVLSIDKENKKIEAVCETPPSGIIRLKGALGYNNGVYILNDLCNKMYGNTSKGVTARSLNIEDIQDNMDLSVWDYHSCTNGVVPYGQANEYTSNLQYPYQWKLEKQEESKIDNVLTGGTMSESEQSELTIQTSSTASSSIEVQQTYWGNSLSENNFNTVKTRASETDASIYSELLANTNNTFHWLASRLSVPYPSFVKWGLRVAAYGNVDYDALFTSEGRAIGNNYDYAVRPVVSLPSDIIDVDAGYNSTSGWSIR